MNTSQPVSIETKTSRIHLDERGILNLEFIPTDLHDISEALVNIKEIYKIIGKNSLPVLVRLGDDYSVTASAREMYAGTEKCTGIYKVALLVSEAKSRMLGNLFLILNEPEYTCNIFDNEEDAEKWLLTE